MPIVLPMRPSALPYSVRSQLPARSEATASGMRRSMRDEEPEDELGDGRGVLARAVRDVDAALARGLHVDGRRLGAGAHDEVELARALDGLARDLLRADDEDADARELRLERLLRELRLVEDVDGERAELFDGAGVKLVGNEETHGGAQLSRKRDELAGQLPKAAAF